MYIKEIEFLNFKSFGKKVKIPFFDDFTTISGPNGSGKSNIIDGILFALGLSNSRTMRAEKLTDLIYNPDSSNKPQHAQVKIRFDNSDREMPVDSDIVEITRKIRETDSGYYSYFYFNGKSVSLKDVHNHLAKAKVTPEGYNVVMQGDVTRIITMTPVERRKIIDEIAGVSEFDNKKERAMNELETVREHIERVDIIIEEVNNQLDKLKEERDQALKYQSLKQEKAKYEGFVILSKLKDAKKELESVNSDIESRKNTIDELQKSLDEKNEQLQELEKILSDLTSQIQSMGEKEQIQIKKDIEEIRGEISRCNGSIEIAEKEIQDIDSRRRKTLVDIDETKTKVENLESKVNDEGLRKENINSELSERRNELKLLQSKINDVDARFAKTRDKLSELKNEREEIKNEKSELIREENRLLDAVRRKSAEKRDIENEIEDAREKIESSDSDTRSVQHEIDKLNEKIESLNKDLDDLESNRSQLKEILNEHEEELRKYQQDYAQVEARVRAAEDNSKYSKAVDTIISARNNKELQGIYGTIAELGQADEKYANALQIAAGGRMQAVVTETDEDASDAIEYLKRYKAGRATFLPLAKLENRRPYKDLSDREGVVGYAIDLIDFDEKFESAFWYVFRDTLVMDSLENARKLMGGLRMVTLDGELIEKSGAMSGGSKQQRSGLSFAAAEKEKLTKLAEKITEYDSKRNNTIKKLDGVEGQISDIKQEINGYENEISKKEMQLEEISSRGERLSQLIESKNKELEEIENSRKELKEEMDQVVADKDKKTSKENELEEKISELEEELADSEIPELNEKADNLNEEIQRLEGRIRDIDSNINSLNLDLDYANKRIEDDRELIKELDEKKSSHKERIESFKEKIKELENNLASKQERENELADELKELQDERSGKQTEYDNLKNEYNSLKSRFENANNQVQALESTKTALKEQIDELRNELEQRGIEETEEVPNYETVRTRIASIEKAMENLEPVNMRAIDEYDEVLNRHEEMKNRRDTLSNEREQILERIEQYEKLKKDTFMDTFNGINDAFSSIFNELSDGTGKLALDNYEDPFSGGLTLKAQPNDKSLQRLEAMSGGEKSLTALAFVFAIQYYRPAPFYAFDEIDMFLDGANAERVAQRIRKSVDNAQFIVVSLRKPMIESASRTLGVTMQENNNTSITGVKLY